MSETAVAIRPAIVWQDKPEVCEATVGRSPHTLVKWSRYGKRGVKLPMYVDGTPPHVRRSWVVDEVVAFIKATCTSNYDE